MPLILEKKIIKEQPEDKRLNESAEETASTEETKKVSRLNFTRESLFRLWKVIIFSIALVVHIILILTVTVKSGEKQKRQDNTIFKMVDVQEFVPLPSEVEKPEPKKEPPKPETEQVVVNQDAIAESIIETDKEVIEVQEPVSVGEAIEYLPQHKISVMPKFSMEEIRAKIKYPPIAHRQKIEGIVYLELFIDSHGVVRDIQVVKGLGFGFDEAAIEAYRGAVGEPAYANGVAVAVRVRYPVRFQLK